MPGISVNVANTTVNVDLEQLNRTTGTLFMKDGVIKESRCSWGRAFLSIFSKTLRTEQQNAAKAISLALESRYHIRAEAGTKIKGTDIAALDHQARDAAVSRAQGKVQQLTEKYGAFVQTDISDISTRDSYRDGTIDPQLFTRADESASLRIKEAYTELGSRARETDISDKQLMQGLRQFPSLADLYDKPNTIGGSIGEHTEDVLRQLGDQMKHYDLAGVDRQLQNIAGFEGFNAARFMKVVVAFHDIGKGLGTTADQHEHTIPILQNTMKSMGFNEQQIRLATNLVNNDLLGEWQTGQRHELGEIRAKLRELAQDSGIPMKAFMSLEKCFYISDASSYPHIKELFMRQDDAGKLHFKAPDDSTGPARLDSLLTNIEESSRTEVSQAIHQSFLGEANPVEEGKYPINLFSMDFSDKAYNIYDLADSILATQAEIRAELQKIPDAFADVRNLKLARLDQAVEMATMANDMKADRWSAAHTQGIIQARLEIRAAGISSMIPHEIGYNGMDDALLTGNFPGVDKLRQPGGVSDRFFDLVDARGGCSKLLNAAGQIQVASSWSGPSMAVKGYLEKNRSVDSDTHFYHTDHDQQVDHFDRKVTDQYEKFAHAPAEYWENLTETLNVPSSEMLNTLGDCYTRTASGTIPNPSPDTKMFDKSIQYQIAMQMELLANMSFPGNNPTRREVVIYRTDSLALLPLNGFSPTVRSAPMRRGASESGSFMFPVSIGGPLLTGQTVPYHRIVNSFMLNGQHTGPQVLDTSRGAIAGNLFREVLFMSDGIESTAITDQSMSFSLSGDQIGTIPLLHYTGVVDESLF